MSDGYFLLLFLIPLFAAIWVYTDAREKQVPGAAGWAILTFFILIIGLPLYLVSGRKQAGLAGDRSSIARSQLLSGGRVCTQCGLTIPVDYQFCPHCGKQFLFGETALYSLENAVEQDKSVSSAQGSIRVDTDTRRVYLRHDSDTSRTFVGGGILVPGEWRELRGGSEIEFGTGGSKWKFVTATGRAETQ